jgi:hypothetical protein
MKIYISHSQFVIIDIIFPILKNFIFNLYKKLLYTNSVVYACIFRVKLKCSKKSIIYNFLAKLIDFLKIN